MVSISYWNVINIFWSVFEKIAISFFGAHLKGLYFCSWNVRIYRARIMTDELLNTKYELSLSNRSGASEGDIHSSIHPYTHTYPHTYTHQKLLCSIQEGSKRANELKILTSIFYHHSTFAYMLRIWGSKKTQTWHNYYIHSINDKGFVPYNKQKCATMYLTNIWKYYTAVC
jgi:hypothetical protein